MKKIVFVMLSFVLSVSLLLSSCNVVGDISSGVSESDVEQSSSEILSEPEAESSAAIDENKDSESNVEVSPVETEPIAETEQPTLSGSSENEEESDIPPEINTGANGIKLNIYTMEQLYIDLSENEAATEIVELAACKKYLSIEEELDVDLSLTNLAGKYTSTQTLVDAVKNKGNAVDAVMASDARMVELCLRGLLDDMDRHDVIDWKNGWWPNDAKKSFELNGKVYFASGELSTNYAASAYGVFYNADMMLENMTTVNIPEQVLEGEWVLASMMEIASDAYSELDGVAGRSNGDKFGIEVTPNALRAVVAGSGFKFADPYYTSSDAIAFNDEAAFKNLIEDLSAWMITNDVLGFEGNDPQNGVAFSEGRSVFLIKELRFADSLKDAGFDWGVVIPPKLNASDKEYKTSTSTSDSSTFVAVCKDSKYTDIVAEMIDVMGKYGAEYTTSAFIESAFTKEWLESYYGKNSEMLELIIDSVTFDKASIFTAELNALDVAIMSDTIKGDGIYRFDNSFQNKNLKSTFKKLSEKIAAIDAD